MNKSIALHQPAPVQVGERAGSRSLALVLPRILDGSEKSLHKTAYAMAVCGVIAMLVMLILVSANIGLRPFGASLRGTVEISGYLCALAVGLCMPGAQLAGNHISVGLLAQKLPASVQTLQTALCSLAALLVLGFSGREIMAIAGYARDMGEYIEGFNISYYGMALGLAAGLFLHALLFAHSLLRLALSAVTPAPERAA